jgi:hypothetical protein
MKREFGFGSTVALQKVASLVASSSLTQQRKANQFEIGLLMSLFSSLSKSKWKLVEY